MAYLRERGNQLAIVHGERDPETGKVSQRILFTLYSKAEALEALGRREGTSAEQFRLLLERQHPDIKFNWKDIRKGMLKHLDLLPDLYEYRAVRLRGRFRKDLCAFTRQLILADPQDLASAAQLIQEHRHELEYLADLIHWRLKLREQEQNEWNVDNVFYWRFALHGCEVPPDAEEDAAGFYERGEYERGEAVFRLLIDCFDGYAEGYNYLGLIALQQNRLDEAIAHFEKTIELGRRLFPERIKKKDYWSDHSTRPYMRGLRNLTLTLNQAGRYDEALALCARLEQECGDDITVLSFHSAIYLNTGRWQLAADAALRLHRLYASESLTAGFALFELGRPAEAFAFFLHGALNHPRAARMLIRVKLGTPKTHQEKEDYNRGVEFCRQLRGFLTGQSRSSRRFFERLVRDPRVAPLLSEIEAAVERRYEQQSTGEREAVDRINRMRTAEFAREKAGEFADLIEKNRQLWNRSSSRCSTNPVRVATQEG